MGNSPTTDISVLSKVH